MIKVRLEEGYYNKTHAFQQGNAADKNYLIICSILGDKKDKHLVCVPMPDRSQICFFIKAMHQVAHLV